MYTEIQVAFLDAYLESVEPSPRGRVMSQNPLHELVAELLPGASCEVPPGIASVPTGGIHDVLGIRLTHLGKARARAEMQLGPQHLNQRGLLQGGALTAFADAAAGWASYAALPAGRFTTVELGSRFVGRAAAETRLVAEVRPVHEGRTILVLNVDVFDAEVEHTEPRRLVGNFSCTQLVLDR